MKIQESFLPSFPFFHLLLHWVRQPFLGMSPLLSVPLIGCGVKVIFKMISCVSPRLPNSLSGCYPSLLKAMGMLPVTPKN